MHSEVRTYIKVLVTLLTLTAVTVLAAGVNFGSPTVNVVIALAIASIKATLVAMFFMHLRHDKPMNWIILAGGLTFLALFLIFTSLDEGSREQIRPTFTSALSVKR